MTLGSDWLPLQEMQPSPSEFRSRPYLETEFEAREHIAILQAKARHSERVAVHFIRAHSRRAARDHARLNFCVWRESAGWARRAKSLVKRHAGIALLFKRRAKSLVKRRAGIALLFKAHRQRRVRDVLSGWRGVSRDTKRIMATQLLVFGAAIKSCARSAFRTWRAAAHFCAAHRAQVARRNRRDVTEVVTAWKDVVSRAVRLRGLLPKARRRVAQQVFERLYARAVFGGRRRERAALAAWHCRQRGLRRLIFSYWHSIATLLLSYGGMRRLIFSYWRSLAWFRGPALALATSEANRRFGWIRLRVASDYFCCWRWFQATRVAARHAHQHVLESLRFRVARRARSEAGRSAFLRWARLATFEASLRRRFAEACSRRVRNIARRALHFWGSRAGNL